MGVSINDRCWAIILTTPNNVPGVLFTGTLREAKQAFRRLRTCGPSQPANWPLVGTVYRLTDGCTAKIVYLEPPNEQ